SEIRLRRSRNSPNRTGSRVASGRGAFIRRLVAADSTRGVGGLSTERFMAQPRRSSRRPARGAPIVRKNTVRLAGDVAARVRAGHPWVYREALGPRPISPEPGTPIDLVDPDGEFVGRALYDADSAIALRVFVRNPDITIDGQLIRER